MTVDWTARDFFGKTVDSGVLQGQASSDGVFIGSFRPTLTGAGFFSITLAVRGVTPNAFGDGQAVLPMAVFGKYDEQGQARDAHFGTDLLHAQPAFDKERLGEARSARLDHRLPLGALRPVRLGTSGT